MKQNGAAEKVGEESYRKEERTHGRKEEEMSSASVERKICAQYSPGVKN